MQALLEFMEPEINKIVKSEIQKSIQESILSAVKSFRDFGISDNEIKEALIRNYKLSSEEAETYLYSE